MFSWAQQGLPNEDVVSADGEQNDLLARVVERLNERIARLELRQEEHQRAERRWTLRDAVTRALAEAPSLERAAPDILRAVCETLGWKMGALWTVEPHGGLLRCIEMWRGSPVHDSEFEIATRRHVFARGIGMPGRVWATGQPAWIPDITQDPNFPRSAIASAEGLRASLAFPIIVEGTVVGVVEFFSEEIRKPDQKLLDLLSSLGSQIGQFIERKYAEQILDRFFTLSLDMLCIAGLDGYFKRLNPAWERILGYRVEELTSTPFMEFVHPDDRAATRKEMEKLAKGQNTISFENRYRARDGSYKWVLWNATPFAERELVYAVAHDITDRKLAEEKILRLREEAEAANRAKSEFLARMSHEIRTPLNLVIGMGEMIERTDLTAQQADYARIFRRAGDNLLHLVNDILDLSKVEAGRISLETIDFSPATVVNSAVELFSVRAKEKGIALTADVAPELPAGVSGDPNRLYQVLVNLVGNALKFTAQGYVMVRAGLDPQNPEALLFSVSDTGIGVPQEKLEHIFEPFAQAHSSIARTFGGTGLGLPISRRLVELMGGRIWAESGKGGSTFYFTFPRGAGAPSVSETAAAAFAPVQHPDLGGVRILAADDSEDNRALLAACLQDTGCQLEFAENGQIALDKFRRGAYDVVLMDLQMPVLDGYAAARSIREYESQKGSAPVPILGLTASAFEAEIDQARAAGCTVCLRKPIPLATLVETIGKHAARVATTAAAISGNRISVHPDTRLRAAIPGYLEKRRSDVQAIEAALERSDYTTIRELGHKMSGTGGGYGFAAITELGEAIERGAVKRDADAIRRGVEGLARYLERIEIQ